MTNNELTKSLVNLIEESLTEIEDLKKSERFAASEVSIGDQDSGMKGKDKNGSLDKEDAEKADDDDDKDDDGDKDDDKKDKKDDDMDKADGKNSEADPNAGHHQAVAKEDAEKADDEAEKADGKNSEADPNGGHHKSASESMSKSADETEDKNFDEDLKKSREESETLMKSYVDEKIGGLEKSMQAIAQAIKDLAESPVPSKGSTYKDVKPLKKSEDEGVETLSKAIIADKLFELKKSGTTVDSTDIVSVELGSPSELSRIVNKYNIK